MPTGNVPLLEALKVSSDPLAQGVVQNIIAESPLLELLPQQTFQGNALRVQIQDKLPTVGFRKVNTTWTRSWGTTRWEYFGVAILGGEVFIDNYELNVADDKSLLKMQQFAMQSEAAARTYDKYAIDGTGTNDDFMGLNALVDAGMGQLHAKSANGDVLTLEEMDIAHDKLRTGTADVILMSRTMRRKLTSLGYNTAGQFSFLDVGTDNFGRQVSTWNGIPIRIMGDDADGNQILAQDETRGSDSNTGSIYFIKTDYQNVYGILGAGGHMTVKDFGETEAEPGHLGRIEFYPGIVSKNPLGLVRYAGIKVA